MKCFFKTKPPYPSVNLAALLVTVFVILLLALREFLKVEPWLAMLLGGSLMILFGVITPEEALMSVDLNVILFLFSLFVFTAALEVSGFLEYVAAKMAIKVKDYKRTTALAFLLSALLSTVASNDAIAVSFTPILLNVAKRLKVDETPFLYAVAYGVTIGSVMTPIGNPQNVLIALQGGLSNPFVQFLEYLAIPTLLNLLITPYLMFLEFRDSFKSKPVTELDEEVKLRDPFTAYLALGLLASTIAIAGFLASVGYDFVVAFLVSSSVLLLFVRRREELIRAVDFPTLVFFIGLFIFVEGVYKGGVLDAMLSFLPGLNTVLGVMIVSIVLSQIISNVPLVALLLPVVPHQESLMIALAAGSTIAGNFTLLGAASNVIVSRASEVRGGKKLDYFDFLKKSLPILLVNFSIYYLFISWAGRAL